MNEVIIKRLFRRKVRFTYNLAALMAATGACKMELGEFYTSKKLNDENRLFWASYGAWLIANNSEHTIENIKKFSKIYSKFTVRHLALLRKGNMARDIISAEIKKGLQTIADEKKNH
jgi:hypothetical protein